MPQYAPDFIYKAVLLNGVKMPAPVLDEYDKHNVKINYHGRGHRANQQRNNNNNANNREVAGRFLK
jgi:hypothetical protein